MDAISLFGQYWPLLAIVSVMALIQVLWPLPKIAWKILAVAPSAGVVVGGFIQAFVTISNGGDVRMNGVALLVILIFTLWGGISFFLVKNR
jgi:hypothetical protein